MESTLKRKGGFGLLEVVASMLVLTLTVLPLHLLQLSNRETVLRIQQRNEASSIAQNIMDSLGALGVASVFSTTAPITVVGSPHKMKIGASYTKKYQVAIHAVESFSPELLLVSKKVDVTVSWQHKTSTQSIKVSSVVQ